jgi:ribosomal-protein-alanine N-acetyltransferase
MHPNYLIPPKVCPSFDLGDVIIREKQETDAADFFIYYSKAEVNEFILCEIPQTIEQAKQELLYWRNCFYRNDGAYFAIADKKNNRMIGSIGITSYNSYQSRIELSYDLDSTYWRRGITTRAIARIVKYAFEDWQVNRIEASVSVSNIPSKNLLLKCGFTLEGILRQHRYHRGKFVDVYFFSLLKEEFLKNPIYQN